MCSNSRLYGVKKSLLCLLCGCIYLSAKIVISFNWCSHSQKGVWYSLIYSRLNGMECKLNSDLPAAEEHKKEHGQDSASKDLFNMMMNNANKSSEEIKIVDSETLV